jgi:transposase
MPKRPLCQPALRQLGHQPRFIPAIYVKPYIKGQKNDYNNAEAMVRKPANPARHRR